MASTKIKGITIEIDGDTTKLGKALESSEKQSKSLQSELKGINTLLKVDPSNVELLTQKQKVLNDTIVATKDKLDKLKQAQAQVQAQFDRGEITEEQFRDFQREIIYTQQKLDGLKEESKKFGSVFQQQVEAAGKNVKDLGSKVEEAGKKMTILSAGAAGGLTYAATQAATLEGAVNKVSVATGMGTEATDEFKKVLTNIHDNNYGEDYNDIAEKMAIVRQNLGDISNTDLQEITQNAYLLEDAFGMDFNESLRGISGLMQNMGLTAEEAFNYMVVGAQTGLNKTDELGDNLAEYSQLWGQMGFSAEEMFTILDNGLTSGAYNLDKVNDLVKEMGISLSDGRVEKNLSSFSKETQHLFNEWKTGGASQSEVIKSIISDLGNMENEQEALTLASTVWSALGEDNAMAIITSLNNVNSTYTDVTGAVQEANEQMYSGTGAKAEEAIKKIQTAMATLGDAILPIITPIIEKIAELATKFSELSPTIQNIILVVTAIVAAFAPVVIVIGKVISAIGVIMPVITKVGAVLAKAPIILGAIKTAIGAVVTALGWPVIAVMAVIGVIVLLWNKCEWFRNAVKAIWEAIKTGFKAAFDWLSGVFTAIGEFFVGLWNKIQEVWALISGFFLTIAKWIYDNVLAPIIRFITEVITVIVGLLQGIWEIIKRIFEVVAGWFYDNVISPVAKFFTTLWNGISKAAETAWNFIKGIWNKVSGWFNDTIIKPVANFFSGMWNGLKTGATNAWNGVKSVFSTVAEFFGNIFSTAWNKVKAVFSTGGKIFDGIKDGIVNAFKNVVNAIIGGINKVIKLPFDFINGALNKIRNISFLGISPFKDKWKQNPITVPQIPKLKTGTNKILDEGLYHLHKNEAVVPAKYNPAIDNSNMKDAMFDALTNFTNTKVQNSNAQSGINELTRLMKQYMPLIIDNMGNDIVLDDRTLVGKITPKIDKQLGVISAAKNRGY